MSDEDKDLFGKIDALFEKRAADALVDKGLEYEDFPLLTEVIAPAPAAVGWDGGNRFDQDRRQAGRRQEERRLGDRRQDPRRLADRAAAEPLARAELPGGETERLVQAMEQRLTELFIRQQLRLEEAVRKAVRDELDRHREERRDPPRPL